MKKTVILLLLIASAGCAGRPTPIPEPTSPEAQLFAGKCGICHSVPHPKRYTYAQWEHMIKVMEKQMEHKKMVPLTEEEKNTILGYLRKHSR